MASISLAEFCRNHGGVKGSMLKVSENLGFLSMKTRDNICFLSFAKSQFGENLTKSDAHRIIAQNELDVLEGTSASGNTCFTIVKHLEDFYEDFDF